MPAINLAKTGHNWRSVELSWTLWSRLYPERVTCLERDWRNRALNWTSALKWLHGMPSSPFISMRNRCSWYLVLYHCAPRTLLFSNCTDHLSAPPACRWKYAT